MNKETSRSAQYDIAAKNHSHSRSQHDTESLPSAVPGCSSPAAASHPQKELAEFNYYWRCIDDIYHDLARKLGLSDSALIILYGLYTLGDGSLQRDICQQASVSKQTIHSSIRNLERDGYLFLESGSGRDKRIWLTDSGRELVRRKICPVVALENAAFMAMGPEASREYLRLVGTFVRTFRELAGGLDQE